MKWLYKAKWKPPVKTEIVIKMLLTEPTPNSHRHIPRLHKYHSLWKVLLLIFYKMGEREIRNRQVASSNLNMIFKTISVRIGYQEANNWQQVNAAQECTLIIYTWSTEEPNLIPELPKQQAWNISTINFTLPGLLHARLWPVGSVLLNWISMQKPIMGILWSSVAGTKIHTHTPGMYLRCMQPQKWAGFNSLSKRETSNNKPQLSPGFELKI